MTAARRIFTIIAFIGVALSPPLVSQSTERMVRPVDEAEQDPSFVEFRDSLLDAIIRRDVEYVVAQASPDIHLSFGGHSGREDFRAFLTLSEDDLADEYKHEAAERREGYWDALEEVLRMGGRFKKPDVFAAPYTWTVELAGDQDPFTTYFVITEEALLKDRPSKYGRVLATLSYDVVEADYRDNGTRFMKVILPSRLQGFVHEDHLRSAVDYRARFVKSEGNWRIQLFIAGD